MVYQVSWLRGLQLVFGSTTAASAAVAAIFMCGLGIGNAVFGKKADRKRNPLRYYAQLEFCIALTAMLTPFLIDATRWAYIGLGGQTVLGTFCAALVRLVFSAAVILVPTILMGGTLPAAVTAVTSPRDLKRRAAGLLYGFNTLGAVAGAIASTFFLLAWLGTRRTLWAACMMNLAVSAFAWLLSRSIQPAPEAGSAEIDAIASKKKGKAAAKAKRVSKNNFGFSPQPALTPGPSPTTNLRSVPGEGSNTWTPAKDLHSFANPLYIYASAAIAGFGFMLMELVWYRMLAPILGGTTYTFGLILAVALLGIGIGGIIYPLIFSRRFSPSVRALSLTCGLEAVLVAVPLALGDRLALEAAILHAANSSGFMGEILNWSVIALVVVFPASIISGVQFPLLIALLGQAKQDVGKQVGYTYVANTLGCILGSLAGGFGLLPLLSAPGAWRLVVVILVALSVGLAILPNRSRNSIGRMALPLGIGLIAIVLACYPGPTAFWRHGGIGAGRAGIPRPLVPNSIRKWQNDIRRAIIWQADGVEAGVAIEAHNSLSFVVNGKNDGSATYDAATQIGSGLLGAILHPAPRECLVVGLGTGETAGWLAEVDTVNQVDVVEIEPVITEMARRCAAVNRDALNNPKLRVIYNDAREVLLTTKKKYDIIASEPSNPYRAGIANLFTREFYLSVDSRLNQGGLLVQWLQGYEIDEITVSTVVATLKSVFKFVEVWHGQRQDILFVCSQGPIKYDSARIRRRMEREPYNTAFARAWRAGKIEGFFARYIGGEALAEELAKNYEQLLNTDDLNRVEYGFARTLGRKTDFSIDQLRKKAAAVSSDRPIVIGPRIDWKEVEDERTAMYAAEVAIELIPAGSSSHTDIADAALRRYLDQKYADMVLKWESKSPQSSNLNETALLALAYSETGNERAGALIDKLRSFHQNEAELIRGIFLERQGRHSRAAEALSKAFVALRTDPWPLEVVTHHALIAARDLVMEDASYAPELARALEKSFALMYFEEERKRVGCFIASYTDVKTILPWIAIYEPNPNWDEKFLELRLRVYIATGNPLQVRAQSDLDLFRSQELQNK